MKEYSTAQERNSFDEKIVELVQVYLEDKESYMNDSNDKNSMGLSVNPQTLELTLCSNENNPQGCDFYPIEELIRPNEDNTDDEPDCDATFDIASSYHFVK